MSSTVNDRHGAVSSAIWVAVIARGNNIADLTIPAIIADAGDRATYRFLEFFTANIRNRNTRAAYMRAVGHAGPDEQGFGEVVEPVNMVRVEIPQQDNCAHQIFRPREREHLALDRKSYRMVGASASPVFRN